MSKDVMKHTVYLSMSYAYHTHYPSSYPVDVLLKTGNMVSATLPLQSTLWS